MYDRALVGKVVKREIERTTTWAAFSKKADISRSTLYRVRDGEENVSFGTLARIENHLGLPYGSLSVIADRNFDRLAALGLSEEMITWIMDQSQTSVAAPNAPKKSGTPTKRVTPRASNEV